MHASEEPADSYHQIAQFLLYSYTLNNDFEKEYKNVFHNKAKAKNFYLHVLKEVNIAISEGNIDSLKNLENYIDYICFVENDAFLKDNYEDNDNPIRDTNLVILACKYNQVGILQYLFASGNKILNNLSVVVGKSAVHQSDEDGKHHNAFYYAIRSGNIKLLKILLDQWPADFALNSEELEDILSRAYEVLRLRNVKLEENMHVFVIDSLMNLHYSQSVSDLKAQNSSSDTKIQLEKRIDLVLEVIKCLNSEYSISKQVDDKFLYVVTFIAKNICILKRQLKPTYYKLPWEEIEFCLVCFVSSCLKCQEINLFYRSVLNKKEILSHLVNFSKSLEKEKVVVMKNFTNIEKCNKFPKQIRGKFVADVATNFPQFEELYDDYRQIRDAYSLEKISNCIDIALAADTETEGRLVMTRTLQIIGEYLKNTWESPKLSSSTSEILLLTFSENVRKIVKKLRDTISHTNSLAKRITIEENEDGDVFDNIQSDLKKVGIAINDILHNQKLEVVKMLLGKIVNCTERDEIKEIADVLSHIKIGHMMLEKYVLSEYNEVKKLIAELKTKINNITDYEISLFNTIDDILNCNQGNLFCFKLDDAQQSFEFFFGNKRIDDYGIEAIKTFASDITFNIKPKVRSKSFILKEVLKLVDKIYKNVLPRVNSKHLDFDDIYSKIFFLSIFDARKIKWVEQWKNKLGTDEKEHIDRQILKKEMHQRLFLLKDVLKKINVCPQSKEYCADKMLQTVIVMLLFDIMESLVDLNSQLVDSNPLFLDQSSPLMFGRQLRNYLAHGDALIDILLFDPSIIVISNAKKLVDNTVKREHWKTNQSLVNNIFKLKERYNQDLETIANQDCFFAAIQEGHMDQLESCLQNGADVYGRRSIDLFTTLHFAAKGSSVEVVKFILGQNVTMDVIDANGSNPLHIASFYGNYEIVKFFVEDKGVDVNSLDKWQKTPLIIAAQNGHKNIVDYLLKIKADSSLKDRKGLTALHCAAENGHLEVVEILLQKEQNVDSCITDFGHTLLHIASRNGDAELVNFLLENNADANAISNNSWTPLHYVAQNGNKGIAQSLIKKGSFVNSMSSYGDTPLHVAAEHGNYEIIKILLQKGANVNARSNRRDTPLHLAAEWGRTDIVTILLDNNATVDAQDRGNYTPLHMASLRKDNKDIVQLLIKHKANVNSKCHEGFTPMHHAAMGGFEEVAKLLVEEDAELYVENSDQKTPVELSAENGHLKVLKALLKHPKANIKAKCSNGFSLLHIAAHIGNFEMLKFLLKKGYDVNATTCKGETSLHFAALGGYLEIVKVLLDHSANVNSNSVEGISPLHCASENGSHEIIKILVANGAVVDAKNFKDYFTPLYTSALYGNLEALLFLLSKGSDVNVKSQNHLTPLHAAALCGHKKITETLIKKGANLNAVSMEGCTPLHLAVKEGHDFVIDILLNKGADINSRTDKDCTPIEMAVFNGQFRALEILLNYKEANVNSKDKNDNIALHIAAQVGNLKIAKHLIDKGSDINAENNEGYTPLHMALHKKNFKIAQYLIEQDADVNAKSNLGWTPLHLVSFSSGNRQISLTFIKHGANINAITSDGATPLHLAAETGNTDIIEVLIENEASVTIKNNENRTPIEVAVMFSHLHAVKMLLKKVDINSRGNKNITLLHIAVGCDNLEIFKYLIENGANVNAEAAEISTPLHVAAELGNAEAAALLLKNGSNINIENGNSRTPVELAINRGHLSVLKVLLQKLPINTRREENCTLLHVAARFGQLEIARYLIENGAEVNVSSVNGKTALHMAVLSGIQNLVQLLIDSKADINAKQSHGETPLRYAVRKDNKDIVLVLINHGADINIKNYSNEAPIHLAIGRGNKDITEVLIAKGANVNEKGADSISPLGLAVFHGHLEIIKMLLQNLEIDVNAKDNNSCTPLHVAAHTGNLQVALWLLEHGANIYSKTNDDLSPLSIADKYGNNAVKNLLFTTAALVEAVKLFDAHVEVETLVSNGAFVNAKDAASRTPLHFAASNGHGRTVKTLLENGANANLVTNNCNTPLHLAASKGYTEIVEFLLEHVKQTDGTKLDCFMNTKTASGGTTSLHIAAQNGHFDIVKLLLKYGASYDVKNNAGKTPCSLSKNSKITDLLRLIDELFTDANSGNFQVIKRLKALKNDLVLATKVRNIQGNTLLQVAITKKHKKIAGELIEILKKMDQVT